MARSTESVVAVGVVDWVKSFPRATGRLLRGDLALRRDRLGDRLVMSDGRSFVLFRETVTRGPASAAARPAVLQARFHLRGMGPEHVRLHALFRRLCIVTTPFFVGLPGFRSKLWMVDPPTGDFAGLYDWQGAAEARAYAEGLARVLRLLSVPGSVSYEVVADMTVDTYLSR